jgi:hypothetical protein
VGDVLAQMAQLRGAEMESAWIMMNA